MTRKQRALAIREAQPAPIVRQLQATIETQAYDMETLIERLAELELAMEDAGWQRIGDEGREFSADARKRIRALSRMMVLKNPIVKRGVAVQMFYVFAQGMTIKAAQPELDQVLQDFIADEKNQTELTAHLAHMAKEKELQTDGDLFFVFFPDARTGRVRVRTLPPDEIADILTNPDDAKDPQFYKRVWQRGAVEQTTYYPDWRYTPRARPTTIDGKLVAWEAPVYHVKVGAFSDWKFGCPETYAALDWARAYKEFLEDWATFTRALSRYAHKLMTRGGKAGVAAAKAKLGTTLGGTSGATPETNPPAVTGATWIGAEGNDIQPLRIGGANVSMEDGRRMLLMVAAAMGLPETFFSDVSVGTLATATSLDRPTELQMRARQTLWSDVYKAILSYVLLWAVKAPAGPLRAYGRVERVRDGDELTERVVWNEGIDPTVAVTFPPVVAADRGADVSAVVTLATAGGKALETLDLKTYLQLSLTAIGAENVEALVDQIMTALEEEQAQAAAQQQAAPAQPQDQNPVNQDAGVP